MLVLVLVLTPKPMQLPQLKHLCLAGLPCVTSDIAVLLLEHWPNQNVIRGVDLKGFSSPDGRRDGSPSHGHQEGVDDADADADADADVDDFEI